MSFLMQSHVFYRSFLIWQIRMKALQSGADDNKNGLQNRPKINEKWSQNGSQNRYFFQWLRRRFSASILERFGTILGSMLRRFWSQKSIQKRLEWTSKKSLNKKSRGGLQVFAAGEGGSALTEIQWSLRVRVILEGEGMVNGPMNTHQSAPFGGARWRILAPTSPCHGHCLRGRL